MIVKADYIYDYTIVPILVIGTGGNGGHLIKRLAAANETLIRLGYPGIHVVAFDGDTVEDPNVGRQPFSYAQIGQKKCQALVEEVNQRHGFAWKYYPVMYDRSVAKDAHFDLRNQGITISCVDSVAARRNIAELVASPLWMDLGNGRSFGQVIIGSNPSYTGKKDRIPNVFDIYPNMEASEKADEAQGPSCSTFDALQKQSLFINQFLATFAADMVYNLITNHFIPYNQVYFNLEEMTLNAI